MRQSVLNILDNAIKYSPDGSQIRLVAGRSGDQAMLDIVDRGPGIEAEHQQRIFDRFYRVDKARSRETGGAGLGLSIAQWVVTVQGGTIEVESRAGEGSRFRILLPLAGSAGSAGPAIGGGA